MILGPQGPGKVGRSQPKSLTELNQLDFFWVIKEILSDCQLADISNPADISNFADISNLDAFSKFHLFPEFQRNIHKNKRIYKKVHNWDKKML